LFYPWRIILGSAAIAAIPAISEMTDIRQECPGIKVPVTTQLKREWSPWPEFGSDLGNPRKLSKG
jgi:hypothetical protein